MNNLIDEMRRLVRDHDDIQNEMFNLWTWLPSFYLTMRAHGDYNVEFQPRPADIISEACQVMGLVHGYSATYFGEQVTDFTQLSYECACGEVHEPDDEPHEDYREWNEETLLEMNERYLNKRNLTD